VLLSLAASLGLLVHQMDVKTTFLNGELDEEIYMEQPAGFVANGQEGMVCKLLKSLYGLKQAPKQCHEKFDRTLTSVGFVVNKADKCVYYWYGEGKGVILCLYVDDILNLGTSLDVIKETKDFLSNNFEMKDLGEANVICKNKLLRQGNGGITLVQSHYMEKVLSLFGYSECEPAPTPYDPSKLLKKNQWISRDQLRYSQILGSLMYLASTTRPDISFVVSKLSRFVSNPGDDHWCALERVLRYLKGTMSSALSTIPGTQQYWRVIVMQIGYLMLMRCTPQVDMCFHLEVALFHGSLANRPSSIEAEWLRELLMDLMVVEKLVLAISMNCDIHTVIIKINSSKDNMTSTRHIKRHLKSIRKLRNSGVIALDYVHMSKNLTV
jgi:hypothetical protein